MALGTGPPRTSVRVLEDLVAGRTRELTTLLEVSHNVASTLELRPLLGLILDQLKSIVDYSGVGLVSLESEVYTFLEYRGPLPRERVLGYRSAWYPPELRLQDILQSPTGVIIADLGGETPLLRELRRTGFADVPFGFEQAHAYLGVPLIARGEVVGVLALVHATPGFYTEHHAELARAVAQQAATAIQNARLYEQARDRAALEERQKLARELHDSVSQALYGIALGVQTAQRALGHDPAAAADSLDFTLSLAQGAVAEMRALIFELRPESLEQEGLVVALQRRAEVLRVRHRLAVAAELGEEPTASLPIKEMLFRVAQEALHNTIKHAAASRVDLTLGIDDAGARLVLEVVDDGCGFEVKQGAFPGHLGLVSMRERAALMGATCEVDSAPGHGTRVRVSVPYAG